MKEYRIVARIKNNRLWSVVKREFPEITSQRAAAIRLGVHPVRFGNLMNMTEPGRGKRGEWSAIARKIADGLRETPEFLFDPELYGTKPRQAELEVGVQDLQAAGFLPLSAPQPDQLVEAKQAAQLLNRSLETITPREEKVLRLRFGLDDGVERTLDEVGHVFDIGIERVRQIEDKALRKLRHRVRRPLLNEARELVG